MVRMHGRWRLTVTDAIHSWPNRFRVHGALTGSGIYPPDVGTTVTVDGPAWDLVAEHRPRGSDSWDPSEMQLLPGEDRVDLVAEIGAEDPLPQPDFEDIRWRAEFLDGTLFDIPHRPFAVRRHDLMEMPDGIFDTLLGSYYLGVHVVNRWGLPFGPEHVLDLSAGSRQDLALRGIVVDDAWTAAELAALDQRQLGTGISLDGLAPGRQRTVYFKVDVRAATPRKHAVEFELRHLGGMADPTHPARRRRHHLFVSSTTVDPTTGEFACRVPEGTLRVRVQEVAVDRAAARRSRRRCPPRRTRRAGSAAELQTLRRLLADLAAGKTPDPCALREALEGLCRPSDCGPGSRGHDGVVDLDDLRIGRFCVDPVWTLPTRLRYVVEPDEPFAGQYGPLPFQDPWWKVLLLIVAVLLAIAGAISEAADLAYDDDDLVIGSLGSVRRDDVDAALCVLDSDRGESPRTVLDAQDDEDHLVPVTALDGDVALSGPVLTRAEVEEILLLPADDPRRKIFKSGARTGLTHCIIAGLAPSGHDLSSWSLDQLVIRRDPALDQPVSAGGDSGSIWVHTQSLRPVALHHSGNEGDTQGLASLLEDVQDLLGITI